MVQVMDYLRLKVPTDRSNRIIIHFDYDCFYASVFENKNPALKGRPLGVKQKNTLATCNYAARSRGVGKLTSVAEAVKVCPDIVLVDGEDLTPFRDVSKLLWAFLRSFSWNNKVERLGFDEVFMDVTDIIDYNVQCLNLSSLSDTFFYLDRQDPEKGFLCDMNTLAGCVIAFNPVDDQSLQLDHKQHVRLGLGSHLANHLRTEIECRFGYTSACGISTNKLLSKLAGSKNKPRNQTTFLPVDDDAEAVLFIDPYPIRKIPGIGSKISKNLEAQFNPAYREDEDSPSLTAAELRTNDRASPAMFDELFYGAGSEKGIGIRLWALLHGVDLSEVKNAANIPSQISIEDSYRDLDEASRIIAELRKLTVSLIRRMRVDLLITDIRVGSNNETHERWIACPKTLRLSICSKFSRNVDLSHGFPPRSSRSAPLPSFALSLDEPVESISEKLVNEFLIPLLRRLQPPKGQYWNVIVMNVCVTNMVTMATDEKGGVGRDIARMFKDQDENLKPWRVVCDKEPIVLDPENVEAAIAKAGDHISEPSSPTSWAEDESGTQLCVLCGHRLPLFAASAHARFHEMEKIG